MKMRSLDIAKVFGSEDTVLRFKGQRSVQNAVQLETRCRVVFYECCLFWNIDQLSLSRIAL